MLRNLPALILGAVVLVLGVLFSVALLAVVAVVGIGAWAYLYWKTRKLRRSMQSASPQGQVFEGEAVVIDEQGIVVEHALPPAPRPGE